MERKKVTEEEVALILEIQVRFLSANISATKLWLLE